MIKKFLFVFAFLALSIPAYAAQAATVSFSPTSGTDGLTTATISGGSYGNPTNRLYIYTDDPIWADGSSCGGGTTGRVNTFSSGTTASLDLPSRYSVGCGSAPLPTATWHYYAVLTTLSCSALDMATCISSGNGTLQDTYTLNPGSPSVPGCTDPAANNYDPSATVDDSSCTYDSGGGDPAPFGFDGLISAASPSFASTTGFTMGAAVGFVDDNLIKLFIGSGMSVLYHLRFWIAALIMIGAIIYFSFRALRAFSKV